VVRGHVEEAGEGHVRPGVGGCEAWGRGGVRPGSLRQNKRPPD
jgi:hypothetical protein